jgi:hypothetical protein
MGTVTEIETAIAKLPPVQQREVARWLEERLLLEEESPEMLAALDEGIRSLKEKGGREFTRTELEAKMRKWAGGSH